MNQINSNQRRAFIGTLAAGAAAGMSMITASLEAGIPSESFSRFLNTKAYGAEEVTKMLKSAGKMQHPVAYDVSQANPWGFIWTNVYYITNEQTGTAAAELGVVNVLRHHGIIFSFDDELVAKYKLGEVFGYKDPTTNALAVRNPYLNVKEGTFPVPGLSGIQGLQEKGAKFCVCNMAYTVYSGFIAQSAGLKAEDVYNDFVSHKLPGVELAPSGVWALGRLAENNIAYIDCSVG